MLRQCHSDVGVTMPPPFPKKEIHRFNAPRCSIVRQIRNLSQAHSTWWPATRSIYFFAHLPSPMCISMPGSVLFPSLVFFFLPLSTSYMTCRILLFHVDMIMSHFRPPRRWTGNVVAVWALPKKEIDHFNPLRCSITRPT